MVVAVEPRCSRPAFLPKGIMHVTCRFGAPCLERASLGARRLPDTLFAHDHVFKKANHFTAAVLTAELTQYIIVVCFLRCTSRVKTRV